MKIPEKMKCAVCGMKSTEDLFSVRNRAGRTKIYCRYCSETAVMVFPYISVNAISKRKTPAEIFRPTY